MRINYLLIKRIHLYACLSTAALLLMFIFTSYLMIHHDWFDHERQTHTSVVSTDQLPASEADWKTILTQQGIKGRFVEERTNKEGNLFREYGGADGWTIITLMRNPNQLAIERNEKSTADALFGIHRQRGYGSGPIQYNLYALLLDLLGLSLILFTITGIVMWFKLLKNSLTAWIIFILGFVYFAATLLFLMYW